MRQSLIVLLLGLLIVSSASAQIVSPSLDPEAYQPNRDDTTEVVDYYGTAPFGDLGVGLLNIGAAPGSTSHRLMFGGYGTQPRFVTKLPIPFGIKPDLARSQIMPSMPLINGHWFPVRTAHFHTQDRLDLLAESDGSFRIY